MSTIWTPGGEYVPKPEPEPGPPPSPAGPPPGAQTGPPGAEPSPEEIQAALEQARAMLRVPVEQHLAVLAQEMFELAVLQLQREAATDGRERVDLAQLSLAIDGMAALVEGLGTRLGPYHSSMADALAQLRLAYVQLVEEGKGA